MKHSKHRKNTLLRSNSGTHKRRVKLHILYLYHVLKHSRKRFAKKSIFLSPQGTEASAPNRAELAEKAFMKHIANITISFTDTIPER